MGFFSTYKKKKPIIVEENSVFPGFRIRKGTLFTLLFILILPPCILSAKGKKDEKLSGVDELIARGEYNGALESITQYLDENPDDFDNTEIRIRSIFDARNEYMELADELLQVLLNEPENDEKKLDIIVRLESMEKNPSAATKNFIAQAKSAAQFTYFRSLFEKLITRGAEETLAGVYGASLSTNQEGFDLYNDDFHESGYSPELVSSVDDVIEEIGKEISHYNTLSSRIGSTYNKYESAIATGNLQQINESFSDFSTIMSEFAGIRNNIAEGGWYLRDQFALLREADPDLTEASFLPFAYRFVLGRASTPSSGMLAALDTHWNSMTDSLLPELLTLLEKNFSALGNEMAGLTPETVVSAKDRLESRMAVVYSTIDAISAFNDLCVSLATDEEGQASSSLEDRIPLAAAAEYLTDCLKTQIEINTRYSSALDAQKALSLPDDMASVISQNTGTLIKEWVSAATGFRQIELDSEENRKAAMLSTHFPGESADAWAVQESALRNLCTKTAEACRQNNSEIWLTLADSLLGGDRVISQGYIDIWDEAERMLNRPLDPETASYPAELIPVMQNALARLEKDYVAVEGTSATLTQSTVDVSSQLYGISLCLSELDRMRAAAPELISLAQERVTLAKRAENEAVLRLSQARASLRSEDFETARDNLQRSRTKYNESLLYQESDELRRQSDELLAALGNEILRAENEVVVREVRQLKTQAKNAYYQSDFERAENLLIQAQSRWETTNVDDDPEIVSLMSLVGMALSIKTGRSIPVTAPLYPEMSQLLNTANLYYNQAQTLIKQNRRTEAQNLLEQARQKLREVQLVYPLNQEASLLTLRIDQLIDPASFQEYFARKVESAKTDYLDTAKRQTVYTDLLDLQEINPKYPGLADFIYKVELALGIRVLPPDTTAIRESERLTAEAQKLFDSDSRNEIVLNSALTKVNQALEKNSDNEAAQILKDRINTALGGSGTTVLTAQAEALYQRAIQELQKGNTLQASVLVAQLLQDPQNKKSSKILDLKKKVDSLL